jgi:GR25 family glycosyltransferase involved in LPS biosynthesis
MLQVYLITTPTLPARAKNLTQVVQWLKQQCDAVGLAVRFHSLAQPTQEDLMNLLKQKENPLESRLQPTGGEMHPVYQKFQRPLNPAELSNYERHRTAVEVIQKGSHSDYHLVLEDDVYVLPVFEKAWTEFLLQLREGRSPGLPETYFALFSITQQTMGSAEPFHWKPYTTHPLTDTQPLIPSKEMYMIHPKLAAQLYTFMTGIQCDARQTISRWMYSHLQKECFLFPSKRLSFDGSKLGMFPSSIHPNNLLIYNQEFMEMLQLLSHSEKKTRGNVLRLYRAIERLQAPDAIHLYAVLMYQIGDFEEASSAFKKAIEEMHRQGGFLSRGSEMIHNAIEFYKQCQKEELATIQSKPSKYKEVVF